MTKREQVNLSSWDTLKNAPIGFAIIDKNFKFVEMNKFFLQALGGEDNESFLGQSLNECFGEAFWKKMRTTALKAKKGEETNEIFINETPLRRRVKLRNGVISFFLTDKTKGQLGIILRDGTEQIQTEKALSKYRDRLDQAQKAGKVGIFEWDMKAQSVWWSDEEEAIFGVSPGTFKGKLSDWMRATYKADRSFVKSEIQRSIKRKEELDIEFRVLYPGKIIHWLRAKAHVYFKGNIPVKLVGVHYDVTARKQNEQLLVFKAEASRVLSSNIDYETTLKTVAKLATEYIADWCVVDVLSENERKVNLIAAEHKNPKKNKWAWQLREKYPIDLSQDTGVSLALKTGKSVFLPYLSMDQLIKNAKNEEQVKVIKKLQLSSVMIVPITTSGKQTIGAITFVSAESKRYYNEADLEMAEQLASRAALAIENARLYQVVKDERERLDELLRNVPGVVWEAWGDPVTREQRITYVSQHAERLLGYPREDWLTIPNFWSKIVHPEDKESAMETAKENFKKGETGISRFRWIGKNGKAIWMESQSFVVKDRNGRPLGMRGIVMDVSENVAQIKRKDEFISVASHELKTPITTIKAFSHILKGIVVKDLSREYLAKMDIQINKLTRLIEELLDVSKIHEGKLEFHKETFDITEFLTDSTGELQAIIKSHKIIYKPYSTASINADKDRLSQVINNLISNAVKYSPNSDKVLVESRVRDGQALISVTDYGIGIAKEHHSNVFNRFYRINNESGISGLGIGLFISREIIARHGGKLLVDSTPGKGSTFTIYLPIK